MKKLLLFPFIVIAVISCGPSAEQRAAEQKHHDDSVTHEAQLLQHIHDDSLVMAANTLQQQQEQKIADEKNEQVKEQQLQMTFNNLQNALINSNARLVGFKDKYNSDQQFKFGRPQSQRQHELENDAKDIQRAQLQISNIQSAMLNIRNQIQQHSTQQ